MRFIMCILRCLLMCGILWKEHALFVGSLLSNWYQNSIRNIWVRTDPVIIKCSNAQHIILNTCQTIGTIDRSFESQRVWLLQVQPSTDHLVIYLMIFLDDFYVVIWSAEYRP
eukprot:8330_1